MADEFVIPDFLAGNSTDEIHQRMLATIPDDIDKSESGFEWDFTRPTASEKAEMAQFEIPETIKLIWPKFASGIYLDWHAENRHLPRKSATATPGTLVITGTAGTPIPTGYLVATVATVDAPSVQFKTTSAATIGSDGKISVGIEAVLPGLAGNVSAGTITLMVQPLGGITSVTNPTALTGGTEAEDDDSLRARLAEYDSTQGVSFVGSPSDYKRWAMEVDGIGVAQVIRAQDDSGVVTIVVVDSNGSPASSDLRQAVYDHIMRPDDPANRLAEINANISVIAPTVVDISVAATVVIDSAYTVGTVASAFLAALKAYLLTCTIEVIYTKIGSSLSATSGVTDYSGLTLNGGTANVSLSANQMPMTDATKVVLTSAK